ncbi:MAG: ferrous iron transporter B [Clostridia bacterium]|nr:ferrous iron transporter B [Clostridia bacterium]
MLKFALVGNPNCGKTTLFNALTGSTAHVGNWPGVTVDKREGVYKKLEEAVSIVDLPGIYSLSPYTPEEVVARNFVLDEAPSCVINIIDATNLERNLYLTTQLMEIDVPIVIALNMIDEVEKAGDSIDELELEKRIGLPVVKVSALKGSNVDALMQRAYLASKQERKGLTVLCETALEHVINDVRIALKGHGVHNPLFHAIKLIEGDEIEVEMHKETVSMVDDFKEVYKHRVFGTDYEALVADGRYKYIVKHFSPVYKRSKSRSYASEKSNRIDKVLTHKYFGLPIFLVILFSMFHLTFSNDFLYLGAIFKLPTLEDLGLLTNDGEFRNYWVKLLSCFYDGAIFSFGSALNNFWNEIIISEIFGLIKNTVLNSGLSVWAVGLINNGIIDGVMGVLSFLPWILTLFLFFSLLEDSGYMARVAFILDRIFRKFGLSGRAFIPMIMGFGCSVPAIINTRTLADEKEKVATIRVIPFFSCSAKLPILTAISGGIVSFYGVGNADLITYSMYLLGVLVAGAAVLLMRSTSLKGEESPFIMELPSYRMPKFSSTVMLLWDKAKHFIKKAFTIILASTIVIWVLTHFNFSWQFISDDKIDKSILAGIGQIFAPLFTPLGFGSQLGTYGWVFVVASVTGLIAKENVVATLSTLATCLIAVAGKDALGLDLLAEDGVDAVKAMILVTNVSVPALLSFIAFNMTTIPCFATVATAKGELKRRKAFKATMLFWIVTSYLVASMVYLVGTYWWTAFIYLFAFTLTAFIIKFRNKRNKKV